MSSSGSMQTIAAKDEPPPGAAISSYSGRPAAVQPPAVKGGHDAVIVLDLAEEVELAARIAAHKQPNPRPRHVVQMGHAGHVRLRLWTSDTADMGEHVHTA